MAKGVQYNALVAEAERAVASVADPALMRAAFEKVLTHLLQSGNDASRSRPTAAKNVGSTPRLRKRPQGGPQAFVEELVGEGFFKKPKTIGEVRSELGNCGHHIPLSSLSGPLQILCQRRVLRRQRAKSEGKKQVFSYSNW